MANLSSLPIHSTKDRTRDDDRGDAQSTVRDQRRSIRSASLWMFVPLAIFLSLVALAPFLFGTSPTAQNLSSRLTPPFFMDGGGWTHPFGTDGLGRDIFARMITGARLSLLVGAIAASLTAIIGVTLGMLAGSGNRLLDGIITLVADVVMSVPFIVVGIVVTAILGQSLVNVLVILILAGWVTYARIIRLQTRSLLRAEFVQASVALGAPPRHIFLRHLLPNLLPVVTMLFFQQVAAMMLFEASLTYLGLGLPVERITLGGMVHDGQEQIFNGWWVSVFPGIAIALAVVGFNMLADWLQEHRDPYRRWT